MSEELSRKRQRPDEFEDDFYEPSSHQNGDSNQNGEEQQPTYEADALPPHMMGGDNGYDDYAPPPHQAMDYEQNDENLKDTRNFQSNAEEAGDQGDLFRQSAAGSGGYGQNRYDGGAPRKRQRRMQLSSEIQRALELCNSLQSFGDLVYETKPLLTQSSETMAKLWSDEDFKSSLLKFLGAVVVEMPHKTVLFSGLIMLANAKNEQIGQDILEWLKDRINDVFDAIEKKGMDVDGDDNKPGDDQMNHEKCWNRIFLVIRMFGLLIHIIDDFDVVVRFIEQLLDFAINLQNADEKRSKLAELVYYEVTLSIPYLLVNDSGNEDLKSKCKQLLSTARKFRVRTTENMDVFYRPVANGDGKSCIAMSDLLQQAPESTESFLEDMTLFYDVMSLTEPLIKTVLTEKETAVVPEGAEENNKNEVNNEAKEEKPEPKMVKHSIGEFVIPGAEVLSKYENLEEFASISDKLWKYPRFIIDIFPREKSRRSLEFETRPQFTTYESMVLNDILTNILSNVEYNRVTVSKQFINFQRFFNEKKFSKSNSPLDKLMIIHDLGKGLEFDLIKNLEESTDFEEHIKNQMINSARRIQAEFEDGYKSTWKMEEIILNNIIDLIFTLPSSELPQIYFEALLSDTCGRDWTLVKRSQLHSNESLVFSKLVGDCFRYFYENIEKLEYENIVRFLEWFVFQISNFKFEWEWQEWVSDVIQLGDERVYNPRLFFIKNAIHKEILITNYKFIRDRTLPADLKKFANLTLKNKEELIDYDSKFFGKEFAEANTSDPLENVEDSESNGEGGEDYVVETNTDTYKLFSHYLFNHDDHPYNDICRDIYMNLENVDESTESLVELTTKLKEKIESDSSGIVENSDEYIITLVVQSICLIGSRSFSVFEESLNKVFGDKLNMIVENTDNDRKKQWIIDAVLRIWNNEPRIGFMFIEKLLRYGTVSEVTVVESVWNCSESKVLPLCEVYADEFLGRLLDFADESDGEEELAKQREIIQVYLGMSVAKLNGFYHTVAAEEGNGEIDMRYLEGLDDTSSEAAWGLRNSVGLIVSKVRKYKDLDIDFGGLFEKADNADIRAHLQQAVGV